MKKSLSCITIIIFIAIGTLLLTNKVSAEYVEHSTYIDNNSYISASPNSTPKTISIPATQTPTPTVALKKHKTDTGGYCTHGNIECNNSETNPFVDFQSNPYP